MYSRDELIDIVSAANIAGYMQRSKTIELPDDECLLEFIEKQMPLYAEYSNNLMDRYLDDSRMWGNWYDWITDALLREYGAEQEVSNAAR